jgi:hypothetical protein
MTIFEWQAAMAEKQAVMLAHWVKTTQSDWLEKSPAVDSSSKARTIMDQVGECIRVNRRAAALLKGEEPALPATDGLTPDAACSQLIDSAKEYADVVRTLDESMLANKYTLPWGEVDGAFMISMPIQNMAYHGGAINYIQTLYGDTEFHVPGR